MTEKEQHTLENRIHFVAQHYKPGAFDPRKGWQKIEQHIAPRTKVRMLSLYYGAAAAVAVLVIASVFFVMLNSRETKLFADTDNTVFALLDNSQVEMQKNAELIYDKNFGKTERRVSMRGNITFDVARDEQRPFIVSTPTAQVRVLGTVFTVDENDERVNLSVKSGLVQFTPNEPAIPLLCEAGARVHYIADKKLVEVTTPQGTMSINGADKLLVFNNMPLKDIVLVLSHFYNKNIQLPEDEAGIPFTSSFSDKSVIEIINIINFTLDTHIRID